MVKLSKYTSRNIPGAAPESLMRKRPDEILPQLLPDILSTEKAVSTSEKSARHIISLTIDTSQYFGIHGSRSLWNLAGVSAAMLPSRLPDFTAT